MKFLHHVLHELDKNGTLVIAVLCLLFFLYLLKRQAFLVAACLHWRFCTRHPAALPVRRQSARFVFAKPNPVTAIALLSA